MRQAKRPTIKDVAHFANVSLGTVSNVLNGRVERMRPATLRRIERVISKLSYHPNRVARQLRTGRAHTIALMVPSVANPFWGALAWHVESVALVHGYQVILCNSERDPGREQRYVAQLLKDGVQNLIIGSSLPSLDHLTDSIGHGLNVIAFDHPAQPSDPSTVVSLTVDNHRGAWLAVRYLLKLGHRRIAFVSGPLRTISRVERLNGYRTALAGAGVDFDETLVWTGGSHKGSGDVRSAELGRLGARRLLQLGNRPTAVFAINDMYAFGACAGAREQGLSVPDDVSVVGFDDIVLARLVNPPLTTVKQPLREMAQVAIRHFVDGGQSGRNSSSSIVLPPRLVARASTAPPGSRNHTEEVR